MPPRKRLYFRWATVTDYQPVGDFPEAVSIDSFLLDPVRPSLYFVTNTWREIDGGRWAGDWDALYRFDLEEHRCERLARRGDLPPPAGYDRVWLCDLLSVSADGLSLFFKVGRETQLLEDGGTRAEYWVSKLDLADVKLETVTRLEAVFA
jgi:hypothetical protein